jgi:adenosylhomocysteine nucleosidase
MSAPLDDDKLSPLTGVVAAMPEEARALRACISAAETRRLGRCDAIVGRLGGRRVALAVTGDGDANARAATAALVARLPVRRLIVIGIGGALSPELEPRALIVADDVQRVNGPRVVAQPELVAWAADTCGARRGRVVTAAAIIGRPAEKARLRVGQGGGVPAVVDLESAACAAVAEEAALPWLVLRAVCDTADEEVPELLNRCRDDRGAVDRGRVFFALLREPGALPPLLALRHRVAACAEALAAAVQSLIEAWPARVEGVAAPGARKMEELYDRRR